MSAKTVFISYRRDAIGKSFSRSLKTSLEHQGYDVFLDVDCIDAGAWANQILTEVPKRAHFLLLLTPGALERCVDVGDWVRREFELAQRSNRNIVPVREESIVSAELTKSCPACMHAVFDLQIADLRHGSFEADITTLTRRFIAAHKAPQVTNPNPPFPFKVDISRIIKYAPADLIGREAETKLLNDAWEKVRSYEANRPHILTIVGLGGEGKTSLVAKWAAGLAGKDWPGCEAVFAWSFYSQGTREQAAASSDVFLKEALIFFGDQEMAESAAGGFDKGRRLARLVGERRALLILDGLEPLQYAPTSPTPGELKDQGLSALLKGLAAVSLGLCVVTSRYAIPDLRAYWQTTAPEIKLMRLSREAGVALLINLGVKTGAKEDFEKLVEDVDGHALTLQIMGGFLKKAFHGDIRCRDRVKFEKADAKVQGGHAFRAMAAYEKWMEDESEEARRELTILRLLGLFDRPATADCVGALLKSPALPGLTEPLVGLAEEDWNFSLDALESAKLLAVNREAAGSLLSLDAHPLLREYFAKQLREQNPEAWRAAHQRLYEHLCASTKEGEQPSLEDLQPLYQAVAHGCQAGLQQEARDKVYRDRILRGKEFYSSRKLGAFGSDLGAVACFFENPWSCLSPVLSDPAQTWLLNDAAFSLRALGRLTEALEPMRAGLENNVKQERWKSAAVCASNLSELSLKLGAVAEAMGYGAQSMNYADRSGDPFQRMSKRTTHADALLQAGQLGEAEVHFREAEKMQAERQPNYPLLYSLGGFRYCDLLLAEAERGEDKAEGRKRKKELLARCRTVEQRTAQTLKWSKTLSGVSLLDTATIHLTLGRAALYAFVLAPSSVKNQKSAIKNIQAAVTDLRRSGAQHHLPHALLSRAWLRTLTGPCTGPESAQSDLDEAWEIAERGPMPLFLADIHLYRARLFGRQNGKCGRQNEETKYPWESPEKDLAEARRLIEKHGYWRRKEELEDAEAAILRDQVTLHHGRAK